MNSISLRVGGIFSQSRRLWKLLLLLVAIDVVFGIWDRLAVGATLLRICSELNSLAERAPNLRS
jgi:hypothetical protein